MTTLDTDPGTSLPRLLNRSALARMIAGLSSGRVVAAGLSAVWLVVAARHLAVAEFGDLALLLALAMIFGVLAEMGYPLLVAGEVASDPRVARPITRRVVSIRLRLAVLVTGGLVAAFSLASEGSLWLAAAFGISVAATTVQSTVAAALRGLSQVRAEITSDIGSRALVLIGGGLWLIAGGGLRAAVATYVLADVLSAAYLTTTLLRSAPPGGDADPGAVGIRRALPLATASVVATVYYRIDVWLLAMLDQPGEVAIYAAAYRVLEAMLLPSAAIGAVSIPGSTHLCSASVRRRLAKLAALGLVFSVPAGVAVAWAAPPLLETLFGPPYAEGGAVLRVLLLSLPASVVIGALGHWATLTYRWRITRALVICLAGNLVLNVVFIPLFGAVGAAGTTVVTQTLLLAMVLTVIRREP